MVGAVTVTHGKLSTALVEAAESITGKIEQIRTLSVMGNDSTDGLREELLKAIGTVDTGSGVIIFTDMFGGTPSNVSFSLFEAGKVEVITGVNLPMLLKFVSYRTERPLDELAVLLKEYGKQSIELAGDMLKEK